MQHRVWSALSLVIVVGLFLLFPGQGAAQRPRILTFNELVEPQTLNPLNTQYEVDARLAGLFFDDLIGVDEFMKPEAHLLESLDPVSVSEDRLRHTFKLREGVMWHPLMQGRKELMPARELTAEDVVFTLQIMRHGRTETNKRHIAYFFRKVTAPDKYLVEFELYSPADDIRNYLFFSVIPKHLFDAKTAFLTSSDDFGIWRVVGTGPYEFLAWKQNKGIAMRRNTHYFKGWPDLIEEGSAYINLMQMRLQRDQNASKENLLAGGAQLLPLVSPVHYSELRSNPRIRLQSYNPRSIMMFAYNTSRPPLDKAEVRRAFMHAVNRKRMLDQVYGASVAQDAKINILSGPYPGQEGDPDLEPLACDLDVARQLLRDAGLAEEDGKFYTQEGGVRQPLTLNLRVAETQEYRRRICEYFQADLGKLGVEVRIEFMPAGNWRKQVIVDRDYDATLVQYSFAPTANIVEELFSETAKMGGGNNITLYTNPEIDRLLHANRSTDDPQIVTKNKHRMHAILHQACPATFLFSTPNYAAYRVDELAGVEIHPFRFFAFVANWYFVPQEELDF